MKKRVYQFVGRQGGKTASTVAVLCDEVNRLRAALHEIADAGCGRTAGDGPPPCLERWPDDRDAWCWSCVARAALREAGLDAAP